MEILARFLLPLHILGAIVILLPILLIWSSLIFTQLRKYLAQWGHSLSILSVIQIASGSLLAISQPATQLGAYCSRMGLYIAIIGITHLLLYLSNDKQLLHQSKYALLTTYCLNFLIVGFTIASL